MHSPRPSLSAGFSLVELVITVSLAVILLTGAASSFSNSIARKQLVQAAQALQSELQLVQREAAKRNTSLLISFATGASWCSGIDVTTCDCTVASDCAVRELSAASVGGDVTMSAANFSGASSVTIERVRGFASSSGNLDLQATSGANLRVELLASGQTRLCSPSNNLIGFPSC